MFDYDLDAKIMQKNVVRHKVVRDTGYSLGNKEALEQAIKEAPPGGKVVVAPGKYPIDITADKDVWLVRSGRFD